VINLDDIGEEFFRCKNMTGDQVCKVLVNTKFWLVHVYSPLMNKETISLINKKGGRSRVTGFGALPSHGPLLTDLP
jgi:hypothetical protein